MAGPALFRCGGRDFPCDPLAPGLEFAANSRRVIESCIESAEGIRVEDLYRDLSLRMQVSFSVNHQGLNELAALFQAASGLLTIEVVLWIAAIASNL